MAQTHTDRQTDGHGDSMTELAQWGRFSENKSHNVWNSVDLENIPLVLLCFFSDNFCKFLKEMQTVFAPFAIFSRSDQVGWKFQLVVFCWGA